MNKLILIGLFLIIAASSKAQINALTENGKQVTLYSNGTWKYSSDSTANNSDSIKVNPVKFSKSASATFLVKSNTVDIGVYINPAKWTFNPHKENEVVPEYRFSLKTGTGQAMVATEKTPINLENMRNIALINAQKAALDAKITRQEYRMVNNKKVLYLEMSGTIQGIKIRYMGYYFSDEHGTTQLLTFTSTALYPQAKQELETFLNGLVVIN
jgi:hypothetical protein